MVCIRHDSIPDCTRTVCSCCIINQLWNYKSNTGYEYWPLWKDNTIKSHINNSGGLNDRIEMKNHNTVIWICKSFNWCKRDKKLIRRWDSEREHSLRRHCTRTKNTIDCCINCATDRFLQRKFTKFSEITQCNRHYAVQGHSRSLILVPIESSYTTSY